MARYTDVKMVMLATMIILATAICDQSEDRLSQAEPVLMQAPQVDVQILAG